MLIKYAFAARHASRPRWTSQVNRELYGYLPTIGAGRESTVKRSCTVLFHTEVTGLGVRKATGKTLR